MEDPNLFWFGCVFFLVVTSFLLSLQGSQPSQTNKVVALTVNTAEIEQLQQQCLRLREQLQQQSEQLKADFQETTFEQLQTLLTNFPTARQMAQAKPDLPAKNLAALFTPLENLLENWGISPIGTPWEQVAYHPQLHQPDTDDMAEGELVYIRFVGYREVEKILSPAKVSRTLPGGVS